MRLKSMVFAGIIFLLGIAQASGQDLSVNIEDLRIEQRVDGGFHLFIRKKPGINSVLLTESTKDPSFNEDNYAYRAAAWNPINGDEPRILNGVPIPRETGIWSIVDSSPEPDSQFGQAFQLYIPYLLYYGYASTRHGEVYVVDGTYLNIRAFALPYGDYRDRFRDNPFVVRVTQQPLAGPPEGNYMKDTVDSFAEIVDGRGELVYSKGPDDLVEKIGEILEKEKGKKVDLVICLDTTGSMRDDIDSIRELLIPRLEELIAEFDGFRIGMVLYKDYNELYLTQLVPFTDDFGKFRTTLNAIRVGGGRDIPEAVHEALYEGSVKFPWNADTKMIILIGDAPPHPRQRGKISKDMVIKAMDDRGLKLNAIILPQ
ncbi:VWA domain-containing protein [Treponema primitia]|uniref:vWA domain-containing protein n=1 Tax=Treponema primitia TaxID=88058 RepID=UPI003980AA7D